MSGMQWFLIILLVLLIGAGIFLLTRKPSGSQASDTTGAPARDDQVGRPGSGEQVAGGAAAAGPGQREVPPRAEVFDQEAAPGAAPLEHEHEPAPAATDAEASYTDTATGDDVPVHDDVDHGPAADTTDTAGRGEVGDDLGRRPVIDVEDSSHVDDTHVDDTHVDDTTVDDTHHADTTFADDAAPAGGATAAEAHEPPVHHTGQHEGDNDPGGHSPSQSFAAGSDTAPSEGATEHTDSGHPGPSSQVGVEATYAPGEVGQDSPGPEPVVDDHPAAAPTAGETDQGHPGAGSQPAFPMEAAGVAGSGAAAAQTAWDDDHHDDVPEDASSAGFTDTTTDTTASDTTGTTAAPVVGAATGSEVVEGPYGPGSAMPDEDGAGPHGWQVKGNSGSMLFHTPDSPGYDNTRAEVWFESEDAARAAGFAHWDRKRR
jgi:hypothetical protein